MKFQRQKAQKMVEEGLTLDERDSSADETQ